ncbi:MAG: transcriptional regulator NrdR [Legionellales bacterium]|nr:transcriptional regulator NrdR [Legionellales bacterium]|tara:strand:+ start:3314 stop:3826 length:513 start_codon:yes stop_codon:yes gene_type:complete
MWCPRCKEKETKVIDSRVAKELVCIRRRRECVACGYRFTTREYIEVRYPRVVKRGGGRSQFDVSKLRRGVSRALDKRPVTSERYEQMITSICERICETSEDEITSQAIGELTLKTLQQEDEVAYVRFASVYQSFDNIESFHALIEHMREQKEEQLETQTESEQSDAGRTT